MASTQAIRAGKTFVEVYLDKTQLIRGIKGAQALLTSFASSVNEIGKGLTKMGAVLKAPLWAGVKVFGDFEKQMKMVSTMLNEPERYMAQFTDGIRDMSIQFGESTETLSKGLYDILSASVEPSKALYVLSVAAKSAKAGITDTGVATDALTTVLNAYGLSANNALSVSDLLFRVVQRGKTTFAELAPAIGNVATIASTANVSIEEMGAALAVMTRVGVKTDVAITSLNAIIASFLKPMSGSVALAKKLGFEMSSATIATEGLVGVFQRIKNLNPEQIADLFPNIRALKGLLPILQNMEGFISDLEIMKNRAGATDDAYKKMTNSVNGAIAKIKQTGLQILSVIGEVLAERVKKVAATIVKLGESFIGFIKNNQEAVLNLGRLSSALLVIGPALVAIANPLSVVAALVVAFGVKAGANLNTVKDATISLNTALTNLEKYFKNVFAVANDALSGGDIVNAAKAFWLGLQVVWIDGISKVKSITMELSIGFLQVISDMAGSMSGFDTVISTMMNGFNRILKVISYFKESWYELMGLLTAKGYGQNEWTLKADEEFKKRQTIQTDVQVNSQSVFQKLAEKAAKFEEERRKAQAASDYARKKALEEQLALIYSQIKTAEMAKGFEAGVDGQKSGGLNLSPTVGTSETIGMFGSSAFNRLGLGTTVQDPNTALLQDIANNTASMATSLE